MDRNTFPVCRLSRECESTPTLQLRRHTVPYADDRTLPLRLVWESLGHTAFHVMRRSDQENSKSREKMETRRRTNTMSLDRQHFKAGSIFTSIARPLFGAETHRRLRNQRKAYDRGCAAAAAIRGHNGETAERADSAVLRARPETARSEQPLPSHLQSVRKCPIDRPDPERPRRTASVCLLVANCCCPVALDAASTSRAVVSTACRAISPKNVLVSANPSASRRFSPCRG